ncbi:ATP-binding protein [Achromobacter sp. NFACC18-2]|uniref:ATP-binding protein n=1 Tax=Achromobacter sp. NFACC18-2 TaxID=1564112 RepID=UPI0008B28999|nr:ATP-binding protein [Achromobacter sp. NFACC18-2]SEI66677.1 Signal transduction histidine kinase [Achromobacter sp. NFACC18-2]
MAKKTDPRRVRRAHFQISAALFEELGERLVSKPEIALAELIKNSYDADATYCEVQISPDEIVVSDDGHGLTEQEFLNNWMVVSSTNKVTRRHSRLYQRHMAGSKGVGRFSARFLGTVLVVESTTSDAKSGALTTLRAVFDWLEISKKADVSDISIDYTVSPAASGAEIGTRLLIGSLRDHVIDLPVSKVRTDVLRLVKADGGLEEPEFEFDAVEGELEDPGFRVYFADDARNGDESELAEQILSKYVARARVSVDDTGLVDFRIYWKGQKKPIEKKVFRLDRFASPFSSKGLSKIEGEKDGRGLPKELENTAHLPLATRLNSPALIDIRFFPNRQGTFANLPVNGKKAMSWVKENSGIAVVDNGFAMPAYGDEDSDWLGIESSKSVNERNWQSLFTSVFYPMDPQAKKDPALNPMLALPRIPQLIGRVHVATRKAPPSSREDDSWLQPNMDREQLRDNGAYRLLWHLVRFAIEALAHFDRAFRIRHEQEREEEARTNARSALAAAITEIKSSAEISSNHKRVMLRQLGEVEEQFSLAESYDKTVRMSLELMSTMGVVAGFMTHEFEKTLEAIQRIGERLEKLTSRHPELASDTEIILRNEAALAQQAEYMRLFVGASRRTAITPFKARAQLTVATKTVEALASEHKISIELAADSKLLGPAIPLAAYHGVAINLVSNAMKALVAKSTAVDRKIKIYAANDGSRHILVCADNGIGIPDYLRDRIWDPLFTTTESSDDENPLNSGLGLGLAVIKRVAEGVGGKVELLKLAPPGFTTAFKASFPLAEV